MKGIIVAFFILTSSFAYSQETVIAVIMHTYKSSQPATTSIQSTLLKQLSEQEGLIHQVYKKTANSELVFVPELSTDSIERAADYLLKYNIQIWEDYRPELNKSAEGKYSLTQVRMADVRASLIDLRTNEVVSAVSELVKDATGETSSHSVVLTGKSFPVDLTKYSKGSKSKKQTMSKLYKAYKPQFLKFMKSKAAIINGLIFSTELSHFMPHYLKVNDVVLKDDKAKELSVTSPYKAKLAKFTYLSVFTVDTINGFLQPNQIGFYNVNNQEGTNITLKSGLGSKAKDVGAAHLAGKTLFASFNKDGYSGPVEEIKMDDKLKIAVRSMGSDIDPIVGKLDDLAPVLLINDSEEKLAIEFRELYKQERFIDDRKETALLGADYVIVAAKEQYSILSTESSELLFTYSRSDGIKGFIEAAMTMTGDEIQIEKVVKQTKSKIKKVQLYNPWGFDGITSLEIFVIEHEDVGGKSRDRKVQIGECISYQAKGLFAEFNMKDGESDLFKAIQDDKKVIFRYREFKFLGNKWK